MFVSYRHCSAPVSAGGLHTVPGYPARGECNCYTLPQVRQNLLRLTCYDSKGESCAMCSKGESCAMCSKGDSCALCAMCIVRVRVVQCE